MDNHQAKPTAFLDRDGTLIKAVPYIRDPALVEVPNSVLLGLRRLRDAGFQLILISNQSGIARGYFSEAEMLSVHHRMCALLAAADLTLDGYYYCPHAIEPGSCNCRKPLTGMLEMACRDFAVDRQRSAMIGDSDCDMQLARNFQIPGLRLRDKPSPAEPPLATAECENFQAAAEWLLQYANSRN